MTILAKLLANELDILGYETYVFECLEEIRKDTKYLMCTKFPNWESKKINIGDIGFLSFIEIRAGVDKWFDGNQMIPYKYNNVQFLKFIKKPEEKLHKFVM